MSRIKLNVSATVEELFREFLISRKAKGLADKTLTSYQSQFQAIARHLAMDITALQKPQNAGHSTLYAYDRYSARVCALSRGGYRLPRSADFRKQTP